MDAFPIATVREISIPRVSSDNCACYKRGIDVRTVVFVVFSIKPQQSVLGIIGISGVLELNEVWISVE